MLCIQKRVEVGCWIHKFWGGNEVPFQKASLNSATVPWLDKNCFSMPEQCEASVFFWYSKLTRHLTQQARIHGVQRGIPGVKKERFDEAMNVRSVHPVTPWKPFRT